MPPRRPSLRPRRLAVAAGAAMAVAAIAAAAMANDPEGPAPRLHVDVEPPPNPASLGTDGPALFGAEEDGRNPAAFSHGDKVLPQPETDAAKSDEEPVLRTDRDTEARPDYHTGPDDTLRYVTVFNPSVLPFKRGSAMNAVRDDYTLTIASDGRQDLPVGGERRSDRDMFWGSVVVELEPGADVALPSVAPDMRILSYEVEPHIPLVFSKDDADNFYVRSDESGASGTYRLVFLADASARYFSPRAPDGYRVRDVARLADPSLLPPLPPAVQARAESALRRLGLSKATDLATALDELAYYFRSFAPKAAPSNTGDIYWDLFRSQAGVCRHRAFVFMITANALGLPTRYVINEAHAWVEVWVPEHEWLRVDLGGAALRMEVENAADKSIHRPRQADQLSKPPAYSENYTQLEGDIRGLNGEQLAEGRQDSAEPGDYDPDLDGDGEPGDSVDGDRDGDGDRDDQRTSPDRSLPEPPADEPGPRRTATEIAVTEADPVGFRGEAIRVRGRLATTGGRPVAGLRVDIYLAPRGTGGKGARLVGHAVTDDEGAFTADSDLPSDLELRDYEVYAATAGDDSYAAALSD